MNNKEFAKRVRVDIVEVFQKMGYGHYGGCLSIVECLSVLYNGESFINMKNLKDPNRDYVILSKGHAGPALYASMHIKGILDDSLFFSLNENGTSLPSHPDKNKTPGIDMTTGSLGQGVAVATGIAYKNQVENRGNYVYAIVGDGELNEGQCWEAFQFAASKNLRNFVVFIDDNKKQIDGLTKDICDLRDLSEKLKTFGFETIRVDGKEVDAIEKALHDCKHSSYVGPKAIILETIKGQGVQSIEEIHNNHHMRPDSALDAKITANLNRLKWELENAIYE